MKKNLHGRRHLRARKTCIVGRRNKQAKRLRREMRLVLKALKDAPPSPFIEAVKVFSNMTAEMVAKLNLIYQELSEAR